MVYSEVIYIFGSIYVYCQSLILLKAHMQCILVIPSEARFPLGTWLRSYIYMSSWYIVANLKKVALARFRHSGSLAAD